MAAFLADATVVFDWLFNATTGTIPDVATTITSTPVLVLPIIIMLAGLAVGMFGRLVGAVRG